MEPDRNSHRHGGCIKFLSDFRALFIKTFLLAIRKPGQTITEILLAYTFMGFLLGMRYILDRRYSSAFRIPAFRPQDALLFNTSANGIYYYPGNTCAETIVNNAVDDITAEWPTFNNTIQVMTDPTLASTSNTTILSIYAFIYFTNLDSCTDASTMPDEVKYTLRLQENGPFYYRAQSVKISPNDYMWKRAPEDFCQGNATIANYTNRFVGIQYSIDMNIIKYVTNTTQDLTSSVSVVTGLSMLVMPSSGARVNSISKALFNSTHWTVLWTILFVYSIQVSTFSVLFGQFFKRPLLAKLLGFVVWVITFIDFYPGVPVGARYFLCIFPNTGLMFCLQVLLQYERRGVGITTFNQLYSNIFPYPLYIGICLLLMLIYSVIYLFLAIYVERVNPGEFGVAQSWNYLFKRSYWKPSATSVVKPSDSNGHARSVKNGHIGDGNTNWIEMNSMKNKKDPLLIISHLTKKFGKFEAVSDLSLKFYAGEVCSLLGHNGAGKTTTTFILVGMLEATSGQVTIEGLDSREHIQDVRKILGFCPQYDILYDELSVKEHLELVGKMRHMKPEVMKQAIETTLQLIGLVNDRQTLSKNLSGGMKRRLSIGISFMGDPKILILDEPTSGIDPYNRRLIWTIIRKMKESGKCIILTTHFLEEADVLSDRIAIMTSGRLQANGTPDFLKSQIEFEYRLFIDKQETYPNERVTVFIQKYLPNIVLERESSSEMVFGIRRNESKEIGRLVHALDEEKLNIGVDHYGLSMTTIEEVFLRLIQEAEEEEVIKHGAASSQELANKVFRAEHEREDGFRLFWLRIGALLIKRIHVLRRQYVFLVGFFLLPILIEIIIVSVLPSPQDIQASLVQNNHVTGAQVTFQPSIYNPQTIVSYANNNGSNARTNLMNYLQNTGATIDEISSDTVLSYVQNRYYASEDIFVNKYQIALALYNNLTSTSPSLTFNSYFSTVNYHAMPVSLSAASTNLFQFYANSTTKKITTTNQPILTTSTSYTALARFFDILYCFDTLPLSLFNFINSIVVSIFMSMLIVPIIQERTKHSKDLQLLTNLSKGTYWLSNIICDICLCVILCALLTIVVKIGAAANPNIQSEVHIYNNSTQGGYFFLMILMYSLASLPLIYVYSFSPKSELIGFIVFFIVNVIACFFDMILHFIATFSQSQAINATSVTKATSIMNNLTYVLIILFPSVNLKRSLFNIRLRSNPDCISSLNSLLFTSYSATEPWMSIYEPGLGLAFLIFCVQMLFWWFILVLIENKEHMKLGCQEFCCCCCNMNRKKVGKKHKYAVPGSGRTSNGMVPGREALPSSSAPWNDAHLDEDVRNERQSVLHTNSSSTSFVIVVRDLVQQFKKRKNKLSGQRIYTAVDHLNFRVTKKSCFGLLGANGAGKTTTFRMLINDLKPTSGDIFINGKNINKIERDLEIGFCPQFDWLISNLTVRETLTLFARLKGLKWSEISEICGDMINLFGLEPYEHRRIERLSGGNKRKVSAVLAFMANPALVFLDEPTTGLDAAAKRKLWNVIRAARDIGLTIILTSHSMEECEALCTKIGIMKLGQFVCLGTLQRLKNRFGSGYAVQVKLPLQDVNVFKEELMLTLPGIQIEEQHNGMLFCSIPFSSLSTTPGVTNENLMSLSQTFEWFNKKTEEKSIESYSITQTTLDQIFVHLTGEDEDAIADENTKM
ncbi:unnamed protein product [Adineta steineri]|uniref:ABC transporter domain-containing protein n=1 Tax=Adineta steineri TaxID=433720 RepID=A0A815G9W6_9BILA|nr:unnamed protein product [Adineta steineri]CAF1335672.1 unnamed protein product [Adineta steineri]